MGMSLTQSLKLTLTSHPIHLKINRDINAPCKEIGKKILPSLCLQLFSWPPLTTNFQLNSFEPPCEYHSLSPRTEPRPPTPITSILAVTSMHCAKKWVRKSFLPHFYNCFLGGLSQQISNEILLSLHGNVTYSVPEQNIDLPPHSPQ